MSDQVNGFTNPETAKLYDTAPDFNWNRKIGIMKLYNGHVKDITPQVAEALIRQGRKDLWKKEVNESE